MRGRRYDKIFPKMEITTHTICKNSADFIEPVLKQVIPYIKKAIVSVDIASSDGTIEILNRLAKENQKIELNYYSVKNPFKDLVVQRNEQIKKTETEWIWILDDDDLYSEKQIKNIFKILEKGKADAYLLPCWFVVDKEHYYPPKGAWAERFFRNVPNLKWEGEFLYETIKKAKIKIKTAYFIHLSYLKTHSWRKEWNILEYPQYQHIEELPKNIKDILKQI